MGSALGAKPTKKTGTIKTIWKLNFPSCSPRANALRGLQSHHLVATPVVWSQPQGELSMAGKPKQKASKPFPPKSGAKKAMTMNNRYASRSKGVTGGKGGGGATA